MALFISAVDPENVEFVEQEFSIRLENLGWQDCWGLFWEGEKKKMIKFKKKKKIERREGEGEQERKIYFLIF